LVIQKQGHSYTPGDIGALLVAAVIFDAGHRPPLLAIEAGMRPAAQQAKTSRFELLAEDYLKEA
jgi:hypothetical protein